MATSVIELPLSTHGLCRIEAGSTQLMLALIVCMKNLVLEWILNFFQDAIMVARSSHPVAQTLIYVIYFCGASSRFILLQETWFIKGTSSLVDPVVLHSFRLIVPYNGNTGTDLSWGDCEAELKSFNSFCTNLPRLSASVCVSEIQILCMMWKGKHFMSHHEHVKMSEGFNLSKSLEISSIFFQSEVWAASYWCSTEGWKEVGYHMSLLWRDWSQGHVL